MVDANSKFVMNTEEMTMNVADIHCIFSKFLGDHLGNIRDSVLWYMLNATSKFNQVINKIDGKNINELVEYLHLHECHLPNIYDIKTQYFGEYITYLSDIIKKDEVADSNDFLKFLSYDGQLGIIKNMYDFDKDITRKSIIPISDIIYEITKQFDKNIDLSKIYFDPTFLDRNFFILDSGFIDRAVGGHATMFLVYKLGHEKYKVVYSNTGGGLSEHNFINKDGINYYETNIVNIVDLFTLKKLIVFCDFFLKNRLDSCEKHYYDCLKTIFRIKNNDNESDGMLQTPYIYINRSQFGGTCTFGCFHTILKYYMSKMDHNIWGLFSKYIKIMSKRYFITFINKNYISKKVAIPDSIISLCKLLNCPRVFNIPNSKFNKYYTEKVGKFNNKYYKSFQKNVLDNVQGIIYDFPSTKFNIIEKELNIQTQDYDYDKVADMMMDIDKNNYNIYELISKFANLKSFKLPIIYDASNNIIESSLWYTIYFYITNKLVESLNITTDFNINIGDIIFDINKLLKLFYEIFGGNYAPAFNSIGNVSSYLDNTIFWVIFLLVIKINEEHNNFKIINIPDDINFTTGLIKVWCNTTFLNFLTEDRIKLISKYKYLLYATPINEYDFIQDEYFIRDELFVDSILEKKIRRELGMYFTLATPFSYIAIYPKCKKIIEDTIINNIKKEEYYTKWEVNPTEYTRSSTLNPAVVRKNYTTIGYKNMIAAYSNKDLEAKLETLKYYNIIDVDTYNLYIDVIKFESKLLCYLYVGYGCFFKDGAELKLVGIKVFHKELHEYVTKNTSNIIDAYTMGIGKKETEVFKSNLDKYISVDISNLIQTINNGINTNDLKHNIYCYQYISIRQPVNHLFNLINGDFINKSYINSFDVIKCSNIKITQNMYSSHEGPHDTTIYFDDFDEFLFDINSITNINIDNIQKSKEIFSNVMFDYNLIKYEDIYRKDKLDIFFNNLHIIIPNIVLNICIILIKYNRQYIISKKNSLLDYLENISHETSIVPNIFYITHIRNIINMIDLDVANYIKNEFTSTYKCPKILANLMFRDIAIFNKHIEILAIANKKLHYIARQYISNIGKYFHILEKNGNLMKILSGDKVLTIFVPYDFIGNKNNSTLLINNVVKYLFIAEDNLFQSYSFDFKKGKYVFHNETLHIDHDGELFKSCNGTIDNKRYIIYFKNLDTYFYTNNRITLVQFITTTEDFYMINDGSSFKFIINKERYNLINSPNSMYYNWIKDLQPCFIVEKNNRYFMLMIVNEKLLTEITTRNSIYTSVSIDDSKSFKNIASNITTYHLVPFNLFGTKLYFNSTSLKYYLLLCIALSKADCVRMLLNDINLMHNDINEENEIDYYLKCVIDKGLNSPYSTYFNFIITLDDKKFDHYINKKNIKINNKWNLNNDIPLNIKNTYNVNMSTFNKTYSHSDPIIRKLYRYYWSIRDKVMPQQIDTNNIVPRIRNQLKAYNSSSALDLEFVQKCIVEYLNIYEECEYHYDDTNIIFDDLANNIDKVVNDKLMTLYAKYFDEPNYVEFILNNCDTLYEIMNIKNILGIIKEYQVDNVNCKKIAKIYKTMDENYLYMNTNRPFEVILFETTFGNYIREDQYELYKTIVNEIENSKSPYKVQHMLMGKGKTSVILPLLLIYFSIKRNDLDKIIIVLPSYLIKQTYDDIILNYMNILGKVKLIQITMDKYSATENKSMLFETNREFKTIIVTTNHVLQNLILDTKISPTVDMECSFLMDSITNRSLIIFDEFDSLYDPLTSELNMPIEKKSLINNVGDDIFSSEIIVNIVRQSIQDKYGEYSTIKLTDSLVEKELFNVYSKCKQMIYNKDFGFHQKPSEGYNKYLILPYSAVNSPVVGSSFSDVDINTLLTIISYTNLPKFRECDLLLFSEFLIKRVTDEIEILGNSIIYSEYFTELELVVYELAIKSYNDLLKLDLSYEVYGKKYCELLESYVISCILPQIKYTVTQVNSSFIDIMHKSFCSRKAGFSGTFNVRLPTWLSNANEFNDIAISKDGIGSIYVAVLGLLNVKNSIIPLDESNNILGDVLDIVYNKKYNSVIDTGAILRNYNVNQILREIQSRYNNNKFDKRFVVYIDGTDTKLVLDLENQITFPYINQVYSTNDLFIYYDNKHIIGIDIKQPFYLTGLATVDVFNDLTAISQGVFRLRNMNYGHNIDFILTPEMGKLLIKVFGSISRYNLLITLLIKDYRKLKSTDCKLNLQNIRHLYRLQNDFASAFFKEELYIKYRYMDDNDQYKNGYATFITKLFRPCDNDIINNLVDIMKSRCNLNTNFGTNVDKDDAEQINDEVQVNKEKGKEKVKENAKNKQVAEEINFNRDFQVYNSKSITRVWMSIDYGEYKFQVKTSNSLKELGIYFSRDYLFTHVGAHYNEQVERGHFNNESKQVIYLDGKIIITNSDDRSYVNSIPNVIIYKSYDNTISIYDHKIYLAKYISGEKLSIVDSLKLVIYLYKSKIIPGAFNRILLYVKLSGYIYDRDRLFDTKISSMLALGEPVPDIPSEETKLAIFVRKIKENNFKILKDMYSVKMSQSIIDKLNIIIDSLIA